MRYVIQFVVPAVALLATAHPAHAQFAKLKKIGGEIAREAARETAGLPKGENAAGSASAASRDYTITAERLTNVLAVITPLAESARRESASQAAQDAYREKQDAQQECLKQAARSARSISEDYLNNGGAKSEKISAAMSRLSALQQSKRYRDVAYLEDSIAVMTVELSAMMTGAKCGAAVHKPAAVIDAEVADRMRQNAETGPSSDDEITVPEVARKNVSQNQFGMIRERIALYALALIDPSVKGGKFTDAEREVLGTKAAELKALAPYFKDGSLRWSSWGDVRSW